MEEKQIHAQWKKRTIAFLISQAVTLFGSSLVQMAIIWYVTLQTSSGIWVTILTLCSFIPQMIISFFAGVWADRYNRKTLIIVADSVIAVATLGLALFNVGIDTHKFSLAWVHMYGEGLMLAIEYAPFLLHYLLAARVGAYLGGSTRLMNRIADLNKDGLLKLYNEIIQIIR